MAKAVQQWGNVGGLVAGFMMNDEQLVARSLQDVIAEPIRSILIPGFKEVKQAALDAGALGGSISGSGPAMFMLSNSEKIANQVGQAMQQAFAKLHINSQVFISPINSQGPSILTSK